MRGLRSQQRLPASAVYHGAARSQKQTRKPPCQAGGSSPEGRVASALGGSAGERTSSPLRGPMSSGGQPKAARVRPERARLGAPHAERGRAGGASHRTSEWPGEPSRAGVRLQPRRGWEKQDSLTKASCSADLCGVRHDRRFPPRSRAPVRSTETPTDGNAGCFAQRGGPRLPERVPHSLSGRALGSPEGQARPPSPAQEADVT